MQHGEVEQAKDEVEDAHHAIDDPNLRQPSTPTCVHYNCNIF